MGKKGCKKPKQGGSNQDTRIKEVEGGPRFFFQRLKPTKKETEMTGQKHIEKGGKELDRKKGKKGRGSGRRNERQKGKVGTPTKRSVRQPEGSGERGEGARKLKGGKNKVREDTG